MKYRKKWHPIIKVLQNIVRRCCNVLINGHQTVALRQLENMDEISYKQLVVKEN